MDRKIFFNKVRATVFNGSLTSSQVVGMEAILDACAAEQVADARQVAYILATPMVETGGTYLTKSESLNYSSQGLLNTFGEHRISKAQAQALGRGPGRVANQQEIANVVYGGDWGRVNLGNTQPGDGWLFRGRGLVQITGRKNYTTFSHLLGLPLDLNPDLAMNIKTAALIAVVGMRDGIFTTKKLSDYINATKTDFVQARRIINSLDRADDIASDAQKFLAAIELAG
ncbi:lysozyme-like protein [Rhizobium phage RHph_I72]|nr:lysozyme-like protein [Rhizobium phage RHph_I65]QIG76506.1 lysozyme-like protein [Rhizobium phage RHph_I72]